MCRIVVRKCLNAVILFPELWKNIEIMWKTIANGGVPTYNLSAEFEPPTSTDEIRGDERYT
jgi:hypothetical protein